MIAANSKLLHALGTGFLEKRIGVCCAYLGASVSICGSKQPGELLK
jgi:hypothetical protein